MYFNWISTVLLVFLAGYSLFCALCNARMLPAVENAVLLKKVRQRLVFWRSAGLLGALVLLVTNTLGVANGVSDWRPLTVFFTRLFLTTGFVWLFASGAYLFVWEGRLTEKELLQRLRAIETLVAVPCVCITLGCAIYQELLWAWTATASLGCCVAAWRRFSQASSS